MAGAKLPPRQKMIGMMYLVLTALLALNVSKEILDAFVTVNAGLEHTGMSFEKGIKSLYAKFDEKKSIDPLRVMNNWKKAQEAKKMSAEMNAYIDQIRKKIIRETEGFQHHEEDTIRLQYVSAKDNYDIPTNILCGATEDGLQGDAHQLKLKLDAYKKNMLILLNPETRKNMNLSINTEDPKDGGEYRTWEMKTFYHSPLAASVTILSKIQDDVKSAESDIVDALLRETDADIIPFDTVAPRVIAQSNYVLLGEEYQADIFLAAFNKTLSPQVLLGKYDSASGKMIQISDSVPVSQGLGKYKTVTTKEGIFQYEGIINMKTPNGTMMQYPFKSEYIVARPALTVSAEKMKVMYAGLSNPISVSVPGVPNEKIRVTVSNGTLITKGNGQFVVQSPTPGNCKVSVTAQMDNGESKNMGTIDFKVKRLPKPETTVSGVASGAMKVKSSVLSASPGLISVYPYTEFEDAKCRVTSFHMTIMQNGVALFDKKVDGNLFNTDVKNIMRQCKKGAKVFIEDIKTTGPDGASTSPPIVLTIE